MSNNRLAILASGNRENGGGGATMARFIEGTQNGELNAEVVLVICNNPPGSVAIYDHIDKLNTAHGLAIEVLHISGKTHPRGKNERGQTDEESAAIYQAIVDHDISTVVQIGYLRQVNGTLIEKLGWKPEYAIDDPVHKGAYQSHLINTHPGLLPQTSDTYGLGASRKVLELGLPYSAHTLHMVGAGIDTGPVIAEHQVPVDSIDTAETLFAKVQATEKANLCRAVDDFLNAQMAYHKIDLM